MRRLRYQQLFHVLEIRSYNLDNTKVGQKVLFAPDVHQELRLQKALVLISGSLHGRYRIESPSQFLQRRQVFDQHQSVLLDQEVQYVEMVDHQLPECRACSLLVVQFLENLLRGCWVGLGYDSFNFQ